MTNEATLRNRHGAELMDFAVNDTHSVEKGTICGLLDDRTLSGAATTGMVAGIASREKVADSGRTQLSLFTPGCGAIFDVKDAGAGVAIGNPVILSGANMVKAATTWNEQSGANLIGVAQEAAAASEVFQIKL
jgi:ABC-type uncharacterized transport system substrate-binding protein|tara:strand:- start:3799 stop:4197 length:399 start_codon:yes stop_codon:yes gene_type:complete